MSKLPKLVRDKVPDLIAQDGFTPVWRTAEDDEIDELLRKKLVEEALEYAESGDPEELADVTDTITAILLERSQTFNTSYFGHQVEKTRRVGSFSKRIVLERIDDTEATSWDDVDDGLSRKPE